MASNNYKFKDLTLEAQRLVRRGSYKKHGHYMGDDYFEGLTKKSIDNYYQTGLEVEKKEKFKNRLVWVVVLCVAAIGLGVYAAVANNNIKKMGEHYDQISNVDVCDLALHAPTLGFLNDDFALKYGPKGVKTKYDNKSHEMSCDFFLNGESSSGHFSAFIQSTITKEDVRQKHEDNKDTSKLADSPYNVFQYSNGKDYYSYTVNVGLDPKDSSLDSGLNDSISELIATSIGANIDESLPANPGVSDLK